MKAILISDHAKWCALMMNGKKKVEVRKGTALYKATQKLIDEYGYAEFYVYCTKENKTIDCGNDESLLCSAIQTLNSLGKVIFKFCCYKVEEITQHWVTLLETKSLECYELLHLSCLEYEELFDYLRGRKEPKGCAIHISDLEIFDKPKELSEFYTTKLDEDLIKRFDNSIQLENGKWVKRITKAPQSFMFIETEE